MTRLLRRRDLIKVDVGTWVRVIMAVVPMARHPSEFDFIIILPEAPICMIQSLP